MIPTLQYGGAGRARTAAGGVPDPDFASVELLLHGNGANGGTTFTDSSAAARTFTFSGNAQTSTTQVKFGSASLKFDGTGDYIQTPYDTTDFKWWDSDFTIEAWVYPEDLAEWQYNASIPAFLAHANPYDVTIYWAFGPMSNGLLRFMYWRGAVVSVASTETVSANVWTHIAMTHKLGSGIKLWVNGVGTASYTPVIATPLQDVLVPIVIGTTALVGIRGYADDIRITRGIERYTADFTPPTAQFPDA